MNRVALNLGFLQIYWYSIFILLGIFTAVAIIYLEIKKNNINKDTFLDMAFYSIIIGLIGARLYYVLFNLSYYLENPLEIIQIYNGGLAIHGGIISGSLSIIYFCHKKKLNTLKILDIIVIGLIIAQAIGRWGNFFNQEAYGPLTTYQHLKNMHLPNFIIKGMNIAGEYYTPTFLYESIWNFIGFIILILIKKMKKLKIGILSGIYIIWYSIGRFYIESLRTDSLMLGNIKVAQLVSFTLIIIGLFLIITSKKNDYYHLNEKGENVWNIK